MMDVCHPQHPSINVTPEAVGAGRTFIYVAGVSLHLLNPGGSILQFWRTLLYQFFPPCQGAVLYMPSFFGIVKDMALVKIDGLVTNYRVAGKGKHVLLLHGWGGNSQSFSQLQALSEKHYKTVALDLPGFGETDFPPKPWGVEEYKNFVISFIRRLEMGRVCLVGHSFGGRIAILLAAGEPQLVERLVLISAAGIKRKTSAQEKAVGFAASLGKRIMSLPLMYRLKRPVRDVFYKLIRRQDYYLAKGVMKETIKNVIVQDLREYLPQIKIKTLILWGDKDTITPLKDAYFMQKEIPDAALEIIKGGSHYLPRKNAKELFMHINRFLQ